MYCMCFREGGGLPFDLGASNSAHIWSMGFGFWLIRTHDSDHACSKEGGIGYCLLGTWLSLVNRVLFENIYIN